MRRAGLLSALALIVVTNAIVLAGVFSNRRGEPDAALTLTERELPLGWVEKENSGLSLTLNWNGTPWNAKTNWFDQAKLEALGFDCSLPPEDRSAELWYEKALPRERYAVLEYEGDAWKSWLASEQQEIDSLRRRVAKHLETEKSLRYREAAFAAQRLSRSRLYLVDVGRDAADLRRRYADRSRYVVASALVRLTFVPRGKADDGKEIPPHLQGNVSEILISEIHVPLHRRRLFDAVRAQDARARGPGAGPDSWPEPGSGPGAPGEYGEPSSAAARGPRYEVTLKYGRRLEPWIAGARPLAPPG